MNLHDFDIRQEAIEYGKNKKALEAAKELLKENIAPEIIAKCEKLPLEKVLELQQEINALNIVQA